ELADAEAVVGADGQRGRPRPDREVGIAELRGHRARRLLPRSQVLGDLDRHAPQLVVKPLGVVDVLRERLLLRDRDPRGFLETAGWTGVDPTRAVAQHRPDLAAQ